MSSGEIDSELIKVGVKELVEFSARTGDLFYEDLIGPTAQEGQEGHRGIQNSRDASWESEKHFAHEFCFEDLRIHLSGRVDLFRSIDGNVIIEEIKTCYGAAYLIPEPKRDLHWAQVKIYAALYFNTVSTREVRSIQLRLTYYDLLSKQIYQESQDFSDDNALLYCQQQVQKYADWLNSVREKKTTVRQNCKTMEFPFSEFRHGQRDLSVKVYRSIQSSQSLLVEAPTGTGKTLSILFPALKAMGEELYSQLIYLTTKGSAQNNAIAAIKLCKQSSSSLDFLLIRAKEKACPCLSKDETTKRSCQSSRGVCSLTIGFYDRLPAARSDCLETMDLDAKNLQSIADKHHLCPFALSIFMVPWVSIVIADVNYFYDPIVRLSEFERREKQRLVLIDEIHNLPDRARGMYSAELDSLLIKDVITQLSRSFTRLKVSLQSLVKAIENIEGDITEDPYAPKPVLKALNKLQQLLQNAGDNGFAGGLLDDVPDNYLPFIKQVYRFLAIEEIRSEAHRHIVQKNQASVALKVVCLDASRYLAKLHRSAIAVIGFSATLSPFEFSRQKLGFKPDLPTLKVDTRFPKGNCLNLCTRFISTQWHSRDSSYQQIVQLIEVLVESKVGNYLVFFPSYEYLKNVLDKFVEKNPDKDVYVQADKGGDKERQAFIEVFKQSSRPILGFAVVGGVFSEGVDFKGDALIGSIIIGTGMPQPSHEQKLIANYYQRQGLNSFEYAFRLPGFVRLMQTAGRVIRSETDRGVVIFVEPRLQRNDYQQLLNERFSLLYCDNLSEVKRALVNFWA